MDLRYIHDLYIAKNNFLNMTEMDHNHNNHNLGLERLTLAFPSNLSYPRFRTSTCVRLPNILKPQPDRGFAVREIHAVTPTLYFQWGTVRF